MKNKFNKEHCHQLEGGWVFTSLEDLKLNDWFLGAEKIPKQITSDILDVTGLLNISLSAYKIEASTYLIDKSVPLIILSPTEKKVKTTLALQIIAARIEENNSILEMAKLHMDNRAIYVIENRIKSLNEQKTDLTSITAMEVSLTQCMYCDGCGTYEGGKYLETHCKVCDGVGEVSRKDYKNRLIGQWIN